ncbi:histidine kinase [Pontibacter diazotrophicus]|uniref:Histidine kinase n=1 Tax=Pontibacter diazotrophicus TaxID=1400979 RepID=A0A3D8L8B8_9BACT|nr:histidine kinase [Pontibacter diazotrophicus]RDV13628.1 histidine kinase [Pontibacter diazotrophicus]
MNLAQVDFQQLRIKHILYKSKVRSMLYGGAFDEAFFSRSGPVSIWFTTIGLVRYIDESEVKELAKVHQEMDIITLDLYRLYRNGKIDEAHEGLRNVEKQSERFLALLLLLENRLKEV